MKTHRQEAAALRNVAVVEKLNDEINFAGEPSATVILTDERHAEIKASQARLERQREDTRRQNANRRKA